MKLFSHIHKVSPSVISNHKEIFNILLLEQWHWLLAVKEPLADTLSPSSGRRWFLLSVLNLCPRFPALSAGLDAAAAEASAVSAPQPRLLLTSHLRQQNKPGARNNSKSQRVWDAGPRWMLKGCCNFHTSIMISQWQGSLGAHAGLIHQIHIVDT